MSPNDLDTPAPPAMTKRTAGALPVRRPDRKRSAGRTVVMPIFLVLCLAGAGFAAYRAGIDVGSILDRLRSWKDSWGRGPTTAARPAEPSPPVSLPPWDGLVALSKRARASLGLETMRVAPQTEPIHLELLGTTDYDPTSLTRIRTLFKGRVEEVRVEIGQTIKQGEPLIDLYSKDLADAKSAYQVERSEWLYYRNLLQAREELRKKQAVSEQQYRETKNEEMKSRTEYEVARDKLLVYGLSQVEIERVEKETGVEKARLTLRAPSSGIVVERDVVPGNIYDENDVLLVITPLDHLWVWGNVFESDLDMVRLGQKWEIEFPFLADRLHGKVEHISNRVDPGSHAVRIRTSIPNKEHRLIANMLVRGRLEIPPMPAADGDPSNRTDRGRRSLLRLRPGAGDAGEVPAAAGPRRPREG